MMKLEHEIHQGVYLNSKTYALHNKNGKYEIKNKGVSKNAYLNGKKFEDKLAFDNMMNIRNSGVADIIDPIHPISISITQNKFKKSFKNQTITTKETKYTLSIKNEKRFLTVINGELITVPFTIKNNILISKNNYNLIYVKGSYIENTSLIPYNPNKNQFI